MTIDFCGVTIGRLLVLGWGRTGRAVADYAEAEGLSCVVSEARGLDEHDRAALETRGIVYEESGHSDRFLSDVDAVILSPGVPMRLPLLRDAAARGIPVLSELDLACAAVRPVPIIAVTGTNGKSSVVTLIGELLGRSGQRAEIVGNIGAPFIGAAERKHATDVYIVEASSFQLEQSVSFRPNVAVLLNLAPDHIERHGTMAAYAEAKGRLFRLQTAEDTAVLPGTLSAQFDQGSARRVFFDELPLPADAERLLPHQRENLRAAIAACVAHDPAFDPGSVPIELVVGALRLPFRMTDLGAIRGIRVINDSKATNPHATVAAVHSVDGPVILMLGGRHKGGGYASLRNAIERSGVRTVILFGEARARLNDELDGVSAELRHAKDLKAAVDDAFASARPGDTILFSPACSSYDAYRSFEERGAAFDRLIESRSDAPIG